METPIYFQVRARLGEKLLVWIYHFAKDVKHPDFWKELILQMLEGEGNWEQAVRKWADSIQELKKKSDLSTDLLEEVQAFIFVQLNQTAASRSTELKRRLLRIRAVAKLGAETRERIETALGLLNSLALDSHSLAEITSLVEFIESQQAKQEYVLRELIALANPDPSVLMVIEQLQQNMLSEKELLKAEQLLAEEEARVEKERKSKIRQSEEFSEGNDLFIANAGLVILWPFLLRFFENVGLIENKQFLDEASRHRAVGLLQFIADGQYKTQEYLCGLNKVLCGLEWDAVLDIGEPISNAEQAACEELLQAVLTNSAIPGELSIDGFRASFLLRKGVLRSVPGLWQLHVEQETHDIILAKIPWSWGMVKLPWMKWGMEVSWARG